MKHIRHLGLTKVAQSVTGYVSPHVSGTYGKVRPALNATWNRAKYNAVEVPLGAWRAIENAYGKLPFHARDVLGNFSLGSAQVLNRTVPGAMDVLAGMVGGLGGAITGGVHGYRKGSEAGQGHALSEAAKGAFNEAVAGGDSLGTLMRPYSDRVRGFNKAIGLQYLEDRAREHVEGLDQELDRMVNSNPHEADDMRDAHQAAKMVGPSTRIAATAPILGKVTDGWGTLGTVGR